MVNNLGVDPNEWFDNPLDRMPIATHKPIYDWEDTAPSEYEPHDDEEMPAELKETPTSVEKHDFSDEIEEEKTIHQKMYEMAIEKHNPWSGGSEGFQGGSEQLLPPRPEEEVYDNLNGT